MSQAPHRRVLTLLTALLAIAGIAPALRACSVPVFRYALEQWEPDAYHLLVLHDGVLSTAQLTLLESLTAVGGDEPPVNLVITHVPAAAIPGDAALQAAWSQRAMSDTPLLVLRFPAPLQDPRVIWSAPLSAAAVEALHASPTRRELTRRLLDGESLVWLLLQSGDATADTAVETALQDEIARLQATVTLPEIESVDEQYLRAVEPALRIGFSHITVAPDDPQEAVLLAIMGASIHPDTTDRERAGPLLMPVFGRGRALSVVPAGVWTLDEGIADMTQYVCGSCSCEVKAENPGFDLPLAANWNGRIAGQVSLAEALPRLEQPTQVVALAEAVALLRTATETVAPASADSAALAAAPGTAGAAVRGGRGGVWGGLPWVALVGMLVLLGGSWWLLRAGREGRA